MIRISFLVFLAFVAVSTESFVVHNNDRGVVITRSKSSSTVELNALWRNWIPQTAEFLERPSAATLKNNNANANTIDIEYMDNNNDNVDATAVASVEKELETNAYRNLCMGSLLAAAILVLTPSAGIAVSGGGLDYANLDITGQDFSNAPQKYKGKDFTQVIAKGTNFANSNLQGCRFYKAYLVNADFTGADIRGASLEDTSMDGASLKGALAVGTYFSNSILDAGTLEDADFTDAQFPLKAQPLLCMRDDLKGTNPTTGVDTRDSAMCP